MLLSLSLRNVTRHRWRTFLIIAGIAISVGLEAGIAISVDSLYSNFIESHRGENYTDITIHPKLNSTLDEMQELAEVVNEIKGVETASPVATFFLSGNISGYEDIPNNIILYGVDVNTHPDFAYLKMLEGNATLKYREVIISQSLSSKLSLSSGILYSIPEVPEFGFSSATVKISGIIPDQTYFGNYVGFFFILIGIDSMIPLFYDESYIDFHLAVKVTDFINLNEIAKRIEDTVGINYHVFREKSISDTDILAIRSYQVAMNLIIIGSFVVEFLFLTNILTINIRERSKEFGILRASGSSTFQILLMLAFEVLIYSSIAGIIGNLLGIILSFILVVLLNLNYPSLGIDSLVIQNSSLITTFFTGVFIAWIAGLYPIFKGATLPVVQNIHWKMRRKKTRAKDWTYLIALGTITTVLGISSTYFIGPSRFLAFELVSWHFFAVWAIFIGTLIFESGLLHFLPVVASKLMIWHKAVPRIIATRNVSREFQKSMITIMVTSLALSFILILGIVSAAIINTVPEYYNDKYGRIDIIAEASDGSQLSIDFTNNLTLENEEIDRAAFIQQQRTKLGDLQGYIFGIEPDSFSYFFENTILLPPEPNVASLLNASERGIIISDLLLKRVGARIGDSLSIQITSNTTDSFVITGITEGNPFLQQGNYVYCSSDLFQTYWQNVSASWFIMSVGDESASLRTIRDRLEMKYEDLKEVIPIDFYAKVIRNSLIVQAAFFQILFLNTFLLSGLAQFICILISTLNMEREIGIMRAMGLTKGEVFSIFFAESTLLGLTGVIAGIINGVIGSELMAWYISFSIPIKTELSPSVIFFWVFVSLLITVLSTIVPSYRSSRKFIAYTINNYVPRQGRANPYSWENWDSYIDEYLSKRDVIVSSLLLDMETDKKPKDLITEKQRVITAKQILLVLTIMTGTPLLGGIIFVLLGFPFVFGIPLGVIGSGIGIIIFIEEITGKPFIR